MTNSCLHIFIIWSQALDSSDYIINDIKTHFKNIQLFKFHWEKKLFLENYIAFYAHSLKHLTRKVVISVLKNKINHCGDDDFYVIVFEDPSPNMQIRETSSGKRLVNINVFDKKTAYRKMTGGGHRIHSSDNAWETNKDLTLLFGLNTTDFCNRYSSTDSNIIKSYSHNCIGVGGYDNIEQLFYVLNNTINYCVLRNYECLPNEYTVEGHGDIDLLVENKNYISYLTLAKPIFPESYRVYHTIKISGEEIPFDFRFIGDNYYDKLWEEHILQNRQFRNNLFYTPSDEDQFYSLLYHAYVQKHEVKSDYLPKLDEYAKRIDVSVKPETHSAISLLDSYLEKNSYEYIRPNDLTVVYNRKNLQESNYAFRYGDFIKRVNETGQNGFAYNSLVYKKKSSYVKRGTSWLIENEVRFLKMLEEYPYFPTIIEYMPAPVDSLLEITKMNGNETSLFFSKVNHQRKKYIKSFIKESIKILCILNEKGICHRDFLPGNLIVCDENGKSKVGLIDFGWAISKNDTKIKEPKYLGGYYRPNGIYSDLYTFGKILMEQWSDIPYIRKIATILTSDAKSFEDQKALINKAKKHLALYPFSPYDRFRLFIRRHQRVNIYFNKIKKRFK